mmetsp:Transcript_15896/g.23040  ORF Transcript_15896/g.23040 Transcript_15896/m.23040 type:complete len:384 (+) Transcript_15896:2-1153(+)
MDPNSLSPAQQETLLNFQAITENYDTSLCVELLMRHNWDIGAASNEYFANPQSRPRPQPRNSSSSWFGKLTSGISSFVQKTWKSIIPDEIRGDESTSARDFVQRLSEIASEYPDFGTKQLSLMVKEAYEIDKPLLIYVSSKEIDSDFLREALCSEVAKAMIDPNYLAWGVEADSKDGELAMKILGVEALPCIAAVKVDNVNRPQILNKIEGLVDLSTLVEFLDTESMSLEPQEIPEDPFLRQERLIREQQEKELKEAEEIVRKQQKAERERQEKLKQEEAEKKRIEEEKEKAKQEKLAKVGEEPPEGPEVAHISFRLPTGQKQERRFFKNQTVHTLYDYIATLDLESHEIVTGFPLAVLSNLENTLEAEGLFPKAVVHIRQPM